MKKLIEEKITTEIKPPQQDEEKPQGNPINNNTMRNLNNYEESTHLYRICTKKSQLK